MTTTTVAPPGAPILAIDLGKYKWMARDYHAARLAQAGRRHRRQGGSRQETCRQEVTAPFRRPSNSAGAGCGLPINPRMIRILIIGRDLAA